MSAKKEGGYLREQAYNEIKKRILACEFAPGAFLNESQIGEVLQLGRSPIHQALHRLEVEGLLTIFPRKGVMVSQLSLNEVIDMIEVRLINEEMSVRLAAERAQPSEIEAMRDILKGTPLAIEQRDLQSLMTIDLKFHNAISAASRNRVLAELLRGIHEKQARFWFLSLSSAEHMKNVYREHLAIVDLLAARDVEGVKEMMAEHINSFRKNIMTTI